MFRAGYTEGIPLAFSNAARVPEEEQYFILSYDKYNACKKKNTCQYMLYNTCLFFCPDLCLEENIEATPLGSLTEYP